MKNPFLSSLSLIPLLLALTACANGAAPRPAAAELDDDPYCLHETGTRIRGQCTHGRSVSDEELESTGGFGLGDRLRRRMPDLR